MQPKLIAVIPHYNHSATIGRVINQLHNLNIPVLVVDDGSSEEHRSVLAKLKKNFTTANPDTSSLEIYYSHCNQGKGRAMKIGFELAYTQGFSHVLQVDADGQHHISDSINMQSQMQVNPQAMICGNPVYGTDAPKSRLYGRKITDFWNSIHTLSLDIKDGMCGFRIYPLASTLKIIQQEVIGDGMDFDIDIIIKSHWYQIPLIWVDTLVSYNSNGVSHFRMWQDNLRISQMHSRLFFGMLKRLVQGKPL